MAADPQAPLLPTDRVLDRLAVTISAENTDVVLLLEGELDLGSVATLRMCLDHAAADGAGDLIVDLERVTFMDSSGLSSLVHGRNILEESSRRLRVRHPQPRVLRVLTLTGLDTVLLDDLVLPTSD